MKNLKLLLTYLLFFTFSTFTSAGEVIGNTYISEKYGYLEINTPDGQWEITDTESQGSGYKLAKMKYKTKVNDSDISISVWASPNPNNILDDDFYIKTVRESYEEQGMTVEPMKTKRFAGLKSYVVRATFEKGNLDFYMAAYMFSGNGGFFWIQHVAKIKTYEESHILVEKVLENIKIN